MFLFMNGSVYKIINKKTVIYQNWRNKNEHLN